MTQLEFIKGSRDSRGRRSFKEVKIVTTRKDHDCEVCGEIIPKGTKTLNENGWSKLEGYFNCYFHLDKRHHCYLDYLDAVQPEINVQDKILAEVIENA